MSVHVNFTCDGCDAATEHMIIRRGFEQLSPMRARRLPWNVEDVAPKGWVVSDPYTGACYCPECWDKIENQTMVPCLCCGKELWWPNGSNTAEGVFNSFCPGGKCEDRYAARL